MSASRPSSQKPTVIGFPFIIRALIFVGCTILGIALGYFIPMIAQWASTLPWIPFQGPLKLISSFSGAWVTTVVTSLLGLLAGLWLAEEVIKDTLRVVVSGETIRLEKDGGGQELSFENISMVFLDGKQLVFLGHAGQELARDKYEWASERIVSALTAHGYAWSPDGDPYKEQYHRWVQDTPDLPPAVNALLKAREKALQKEEGREAKELRSEVAKHGVVVHDEETRQYWRMQAIEPR
ncbi:hypothetical protein SAMN04487970_102275 [Paenibacillus tianmuensis]|uniref:DUF308 domain-containing protein n=1 Tax=Paenibacillus tianmuensis TaxID=624147 RepID=A0A1G4S348_9BACL|nr:hypothetical protein [Paenibacillus tianmuensis]SCW63692.1 hypothetical protein SAMN04487970_102275 [Paenibacillus tianmuensis]